MTTLAPTHSVPLSSFQVWIVTGLYAAASVALVAVPTLIILAYVLFG